MLAILKLMAGSRCCVSFIDADVQVDADSLYEAVAAAVAQFREDSLLAHFPKPATEFTVSVLKPPVEHKIRLNQVEHWAKPSNIGEPAGIIKREKVRKLLGHTE